MHSPVSQSKRRGAIIAYAPLSLWICLIFYLSSGHGSFDETSRFIGPLLKFLFPAASAETLATYHGLIRKLAHLVAYAVLALLAMRAFFDSSIGLLKSRLILSALGLAIIVAILDELNQSFTASRTGSAVDVLIDAAGAFVAVMTARTLGWPRA